MSSVDKLLVTNIRQLKQKYSKNYGAVQKALKALIQADKQQGLITKLVDLSSAAQMATYRAKAIVDPAKQRDTKNLIDKIFNALSPAYLVIIGAPDVVCHQLLNNPVDDEDAKVPSDLPYACAVAYSTKVSDYCAPTRVLGRIPDAQGATEPALLIALLSFAAGYRPGSVETYSEYFALSTASWAASTRKSLRNMFGNDSRLLLSPPKGWKWSRSQLKPSVHFINCHGATLACEFFGEPRDYPVAHSSVHLKGRITEGTIVAAECCYGAELYDALESDGVPGICYQYLVNAAYGFFGSTTVAYGPASGNGAADLVTQDFIRHIKAGASLGRAALQARQDFVLKNSIMDPVNLKTLAQFILLGDPSIHCVGSASRAAPGKKMLLGRSMVKSLSSHNATDRQVRRVSLEQKGRGIAAAASYAGRKLLKTSTRSTAMRRMLAKQLKVSAANIKVESYQVTGGKNVSTRSWMAKSAQSKAKTGVRIHMAIASREAPKGGALRTVIAIAREADGELGEVTLYFSKSS